MNTLVYVFDSLRADWVGPDGVADTPHIDRLIEDSIWFENAYSQAIYTGPSSASIFTGLYPRTHQSNQWNKPLSPAFPRLSEGIGDVQSACFSATSVVSPERGFDYGFDEFFLLANEEPHSPGNTQDLTNAACEWIQEHQDQDFLAVVWSMAPHHPYHTPETVASNTGDRIDGTIDTIQGAPAEYTDRVQELYTDAIEYADKEFGRLLNRLKAMGQYEDSTIIATADHGEIFDEHARHEHLPAIVQKPLTALLGTKRTCQLGLFYSSAFVGHQAIFPYDELLHVPLIIKPADTILDQVGPTNSSCTDMVELIDIAPTVRNLYREIGNEMEGNPLIGPDGPNARDAVFSESRFNDGNTVYKSVRTSGHKLCQLDLVRPSRNELIDTDVWRSIVSYLLGPREVLIQLPDEIRADHPKVTTSLRDKLTRHEQECDQHSELFGASPQAVQLSDDTEQQLVDLGYK